MTPAQHIAQAELLLARARTTCAVLGADDAVSLTGQAIVHALIALAVEQGVPHDTITAGGPSSA